MVKVPYAEIDDVIHFAQTRDIDYWVVSTMYVPKLRPRFEPLLRPEIRREGLKPLVVYGNEGGPRIIVYEFLNQKG
jgi:hypothetical protein